MPPTPSALRPSSYPTPHAITTPSKKPDNLEELRSRGVKVLVILAIFYVYGDVTVARRLKPDQRQDQWLLMASPLPIVAICMAYVGMATYWGPRFMANREAIGGLRPYMMLYNAFQVIYSAYVFWEAGMGGWFGSYSFVCQLCDYSNNPMAIRMLHAGYWYLVSKFLDFIDTMFFVLNKKTEHISLLHVCHHAVMPLCMWYGIKHYSGGHTTLTFLLNSLVHVAMYLYYLLAAMGPIVRPYLWWKKYLTKLQMVQFSIVIVQNFLVLLVECNIPAVLLVWTSSVAFLFFFLFADFYIKEYRRKRINQASVGVTRNGTAGIKNILQTNSMTQDVSLTSTTSQVTQVTQVTVRTRTSIYPSS